MGSPSIRERLLDTGKFDDFADRKLTVERRFAKYRIDRGMTFFQVQNSPWKDVLYRSKSEKKTIIIETTVICDLQAQCQITFSQEVSANIPTLCDLWLFLGKFCNNLSLFHKTIML